MRQFLGAGVITAASLAIIACGSSETEPAKPAPPAAAQPAKTKAAMAEPAKASEAQKQELLDLMVWANAGAARDKRADALACDEQTQEDPALQKGVHGLVVVQRWMQCMEGLGWQRKKQG